MAKYGTKSKDEVEKAMPEFKEGKLKSGKSGKKVRNPVMGRVKSASRGRVEIGHY